MSDIVRLKTRAEIDEEAAAWTWRLDSPAVTVADQEAFESWLRQDLRHRRAIDEMSQAWNALDGLAEFHGGAMAALASDSLRSVRRTRIQWWSAAAAAMLLTVSAAVFWERGGERQTLATAVGQHRVVTLADGSIVTLNTNTILETDFRRRSRDIYLRKGEAHFQVMHDRSRPFFVHAGEAVVRAVGTQFEVRVLADERVDVVVNEGRVEVQAAPALAMTPGAGAGHHGPPAHAARALDAGEQLTASGEEFSVTIVTSQQLASALAWREGAIVFDGEPLAAAIADIERYTDARIVITDPQIGALRVGGRFRTGDLAGFFEALQSALPVSVRHASDGLIYIDSRR